MNIAEEYRSLSIDAIDILKILPHKYPFLMVDKVIDLIPEKKIVALKNISMNEQLFIGHFPSNPVFPGVMAIEAMAQACAILSFVSDNKSLIRDNKINLTDSVETILPYLVKVDDAVFRAPIRPGDSVFIESTITSSRRNFCVFECFCKVNSIVVSSAKIMATSQ